MRTSVALIGGTLLSLVAGGGWSADTRQNSQSQALQVCTLQVSGMTCGGCEAAVRNAARKVDGVKDVKASYKTGIAEVTYDPARTTPESIAKAVTDKSGFKAEVAHPTRK